MKLFLRLMNNLVTFRKITSMLTLRISTSKQMEPIKKYVKKET